MHLVKIIQGSNNGFVTVVPERVVLTPVGSIEVAQRVLLAQVKEELKKLDSEVDPVIDDKNYRSITDNSIVDCDTDDHYTVSTLETTNEYYVVGEVSCDEGATQVTWFLVD